MHRRFCILGVFSVVAASAFGASRTSAIETPNVSLISLIANPAKYDRKYIRVMGVAYFDSPHYINASFLTREDKRKGNTSNSVFIYFAPSVVGGDKLNDKFVLVQGVFRADVRGHLNFFPSGLTQVDRVEAVQGNVR